jgi:hypothetical protein
VSQPTAEQPGRSFHGPPPGDLPVAPGNPYGMPVGYPVVPPKKSNVRKAVLITLAVALVLGSAGVTTFVLTSRKAVNNAKRAAARVAIVEPRSLGGRAPLIGPQYTAMTDVMEKGLAKYKDATNLFGALYGDADDQDVVIAIAVERPVLAPKAALVGAFRGLTSGGMRINDVAAVEPGPLGGTAQCGTGNTDGTDIAVCGWADEGSIGILMWYHSSAEQVTTEFIKLRAEIETKTT